MAKTNEFLGYRVTNEEEEYYVDTRPDGTNFTVPIDPTPTASGPAPISAPDAYRRMAAFIEANPSVHVGYLYLEPVYRETTPVEDCAHELGGLLEGLLARHNCDLGLSRSQIDAILAKDLTELKNLGFIAGIPGRKA